MMKEGSKRKSCKYIIFAVYKVSIFKYVFQLNLKYLKAVAIVNKGLVVFILKFKCIKFQFDN